ASPSAARGSSSMRGSTRKKTSAAISRPKTTRGSRATTAARSGAATSPTTASLVTSPRPRSSSMARSMSCETEGRRTRLTATTLPALPGARQVQGAAGDGDGVAADVDAAFAQCTDELAAAAAELARPQLALAQALGPQRDE